MDSATVIGLIGAFLVLAIAIFIGGSPVAFFDIPSIMIVFFGTLLVTLVKFSLGQFLSATKVAINAFRFKVGDPDELIDKSIELATEARAKGPLSLEDADIPDEFYKKGIDLMVDGHKVDVIQSILRNDRDLTVKRHKNGQAIFKAIGEVAPAMGMIGTLIGLVQMLSKMDDPKQIGPAMAVALLTTLYGAVIANMVANPIANKLELRSTEEWRTKSLIIDAILAIQDNQNPRVIRDMLMNYLPKSQRTTEERTAETAEAA